MIMNIIKKSAPFDLLKVLIAVAESKNFRVAAEKLQMSQPVRHLLVGGVRGDERKSLDVPRKDMGLTIEAQRRQTNLHSTIVLG